MPFTAHIKHLGMVRIYPGEDEWNLLPCMDTWFLTARSKPKITIKLHNNGFSGKA